MKYTKKILSALVAVIMIAAMSVTAFADDYYTTTTTAAPPPTYKITINNENEGHEYEAYQIFQGNITTNLDGDEVLTDISWGYNVDAATVTTNLNNNTTLSPLFATLSEPFSAADVAKIIQSYENDGAVAKELAQVFGNSIDGTAVGTSIFADKKYTISGLDAGYYLVKDKNASISADKDDAYTRFILKVVQNVSADPKSSTPTVKKFVKDIDESTSTDFTGWQKSADYKVGEEVPFRLEGTLPTTYEDYSVYKYVFNDTLDDGFTYKEDSVKVYVENAGVKQEISVTPVISGQNMTVTFDDLKSVSTDKEGNPVTIDKDSKIAVEYLATLDDDAILGSAGNKGAVELVYSNNPNRGSDGKQLTDTGKTPKDEVIVFTYKVVVNKLDDNGNPLAGATFALYKKVSGQPDVLVSGSVNTEGNVFTFSGIDDGDYVLKETSAPSGYNPVDDIEFTVSATHHPDYLYLTALSGNVTSGEAAFLGNSDAGSLSTDVINNLGALLPETGGMGTTVLYIIGALLVVGAGVMLFVRKRMSVSSK